ncbi:MAG: sugar transferase [Phycisphaerae bacterium]
MTHSKAWRQYRTILIAADAVAVCLAYILADVLRCRFWLHTDWPEFHPAFGSTERIHFKILVFLPLAWPLLLAHLRWYEQRWRSWNWTLRTVLTATTLLVLLMATLALLLERVRYPRIQIAFVALLLPATALAVRGISGWVSRWYGSRGRHRVLIVGTDREAVRFRRLLRSIGIGRPTVVGHLRGPWEQDPARVEAGEILGNSEELGPILDDNVVDEVVFSTPIEHLGEVLPYVRLCEEVGVTAHIQAESMACHAIPEMIDFHGVALLAYTPAQHSPEWLALKRMLDVILAVIGIGLTGPIMLICAALIRLTSPGPVLFRQPRCGLNGRIFDMFKFRSMVEDAEHRLHEVAHLDQSPDPPFKAIDDTRITSIGKHLRVWSLDELPQLFNVIRGDMSIVGPRPPIPAEVAQYDRWQRRRLSMRPGLTCIWQIKGRHHIGFKEWMKLDLFYIDHWSLKLDFLILCRTLPTVLRGTGA